MGDDNDRMVNPMGETRYCPYCGAELKAEDETCPSCGQFVGEPQSLHRDHLESQRESDNPSPDPISPSSETNTLSPEHEDPQPRPVSSQPLSCVSQPEDTTLSDYSETPENRTILYTILAVLGVILVTGGIWFGYTKGREQKNSSSSVTDRMVAQDSATGSTPVTKDIPDSERPDFNGYAKLFDNGEVAYYYNDKSFEKYDIRNNVSSKILYIDGNGDVYPDMSSLVASVNSEWGCSVNENGNLSETGIKEIKADSEGRNFVVVFLVNGYNQKGLIPVMDVLWYNADNDRFFKFLPNEGCNEVRIQGHQVVMGEVRQVNPDAQSGYEEDWRCRDIYYNFNGDLVGYGKWNN